MNQTPPTDDATRPIPPRYWWLKRILLAAGVLILALAALRWWWGWEAERRLQAKIDEYHALGQPVTIEDFQFPPVPDKDNAAYFLIRAAAGVAVDPNSTLSVSNVLDSPEMMETRAAAVRRLIAANVTPLRQVRLARSKQQVDWGIRFTRPIVNITGTVLPFLSPQRQLTRLLWVAAVWQHRSGDDAAAVETLRDVLAQGNRLGEMRGVLISYLVTIAIDALAINAVEVIAPTLQVAPMDARGQVGDKAAAREQVAALIAELLDDEPLRESWRWAMYGERLMQLDSVALLTTAPGQLLASGAGPGLGTSPGLVHMLLRPMYKVDLILMMEHCTAVMEAGTAESYVAAGARMPRYPSFDSGIQRLSHTLSAILLPSMERAAELHFRALALRRMAATALAIRLYELDHGRRPQSLDELAPEYLSAVPVDPFAADGRTFGYRPDAPTPVLYSVGVDGVDEEGEYALTKQGSVDQNVKDLVFFLNGDRPRQLPEALAPDPNAPDVEINDREKIGDEGQPDEDQAADDE